MPYSLFFFIAILSNAVILLLKPAQAILCFDGAQCGYACGECEGVGCLKLVRQVSNPNGYGGSSVEQRVAFTCLPNDALDTEPAGCRTDPINNQRVCVCYDRDFCNGVPKSYTINMITFVFVVSITAIFFGFYS